jgi:Secretion system C-terminal sorting domain/Carbohydrate binding domain
MKKNLFLIFVLFAFSANSQNILKNSNLSNGWHDWDASGCHPIIGGTYGYVGQPYWFESTFGGVSTTNLVAQVGGGACLQQILPLVKGVTYQIKFKGARRCESDNFDIPPTLSLVVRVLGTTSFTMYSEVIYNYTNTTWNWHNETQTFTIPETANDNQVYFSLTGYNITTEFGPIVDDVFIEPIPTVTVNSPATAGINTGTNWSLDNLPATGVNYSWSFPGATPSSSTLANPTNIQWATTGIKNVSVVLNNGTGDMVTINKPIEIHGVLPVSLLSLNALAKNNTVELKWVTTNEINNAYFEAYRSKDGVNWEPAGKVNSNGINGGTYTLVDMHPAAGLNYYKLKQVDINSTYKFSNIIKVNLKPGATTDVSIYPNLVNNVLNYAVQKPAAEKLTVVLSDITGRRISNSMEYFAAGTTQKTIDVSKLAPGMYLLTVTDENGTFKKSVPFKKN